MNSFNLHGSLLVQSMLKFTRPDLIVNSLLSLSAAELQAVCCDSAGSHVITAFVNSPTVTQGSRLYALLKVMKSSLFTVVVVALAVVVIRVHCVPKKHQL